MKNTLGDNVRLTIWGESHGPAIGAVLDGICPGIKIDEEFIKSQLNKRRPMNKIETSRKEDDEFRILSGVFNGYTTGEAISVLIENKNVKSIDYDEIASVARPSHADYVAYEKSHGYNDYRGGGHFSGRITAAIVVIGAILISALKEKNIYIGTHIKKCYNIEDRDFNNILEDLKILEDKQIPTLNNIEEEIIKTIENAAYLNDSVGGILQTVVYGLPVGLGDPWFSSVEGKLSLALFGVGGVKGIEFGTGFKLSEMLGSNANDNFEIINNQVQTKTNHNGGINGGITNGMPVMFNVVVKPTSSISQVQDTINFKTKENTTLEIKGRHDPAIIRRASVVIDSITALVIFDLLVTKYGNDSFKFGE